MFHLVDRASELEMHVEAGTLAGVFHDGLAALRELLGGRRPGEPLRREVVMEASDPARLFAAWLERLVSLAEREGFVPERAAGLAVDERRLTATVHGHRGNPPRLVKAVSDRDLIVEPQGEGWRATAVLEV